MECRASQDLFDALVSVKQKDIAGMATPFAGPLSKSQATRDNAFLTILAHEPVQAYLKKLHVATPKLLALTLPPSTPEIVRTFYTKRTAPEIHKFLTKTIENMRTLISRIAGMMEKLSSSEQQDMEGIRKALRSLIDRASLSAHILWLFVYSSAAPAHFERIKVLLTKRILTTTAQRDLELLTKRKNDRNAKIRKELKTKQAKEERMKQAKEKKTMHAWKRGSTSSLSLDSEPMETQDWNSVPDDIDEELEGSFHEYDEDDNVVVGGSVNPDEDKWKPTVRQYMRWLRRQVSHIESLKRLCHMCRKFSELDKPPQISIKVLAVASQGEETKPWRDVI